MSINITNTVKEVPQLPYLEIKLAVLGKKYDLNLVFIGPAKAKKLNETTRQKSYIPNVLSFPLDKNTGEIYIAPSVAKKEAKKFSLSIDGYIGYLFIHGLLHLKGLDHGNKMDQAEKRLMKKFSLK